MFLQFLVVYVNGLEGRGEVASRDLKRYSGRSSRRWIRQPWSQPSKQPLSDSILAVLFVSTGRTYRSGAKKLTGVNSSGLQNASPTPMLSVLPTLPNP